MSWPQVILMLLLIGTCSILMLVILLQRGRGAGLAGAFGGGGGGAFGAKTGDVLTWATVIIATVFLLLAVVANFAFDQTPKTAAVGAPEVTPVDTGAESMPAGTTLVPVTASPDGTIEVPSTGIQLEPVPAPTENSPAAPAAQPGATPDAATPEAQPQGEQPAGDAKPEEPKPDPNQPTDPGGG